ncbi:PIG-L deacetylase family protein [Chloroflexota bacterium]
MKILLLSPHTDDIELGAGGTLVKLLEENNDIHWVVFSICADAVPQGLPSDTLKNEFISVASGLGIKNYRLHDFPRRIFPQYRQEILDELHEIKREFKPHLVIAPSLNDIHQDHKTVAIISEAPANNTVLVHMIRAKLCGGILLFSEIV